MLLPTSPPTSWPISYRELDRVSDEVAVGLAGARPRRRRRARAGAAQRSRVPVRVPGRGQARRRHRGRERSPRARRARRGPRARAAAARPRLPPTSLPDSLGRRGWSTPRRPSTASRPRLRVAGEAPPSGRSTPTIPSPSSSPRARPGCRRARCSAPASCVHHRHRRRRRLGRRWAGLVGTSMAHLGFMTKLPGNLRRGGTNFIMRRWRADEALRISAEQRMTTIAGVPAQFALDAAPAGLRRVRPRQRRVPRRPAAGRSPRTSPRRPASASTPRCRRATRAPRPASGSAPRSTIRAEDAVVTRRSPPSRRRARAARRGRPAGAGGRGRPGLPALPRRHGRVLARRRGDAGRVHRRRLRPHRRPRLARRRRSAPPRRPQQGDVRPRRLQRVPRRGRGACSRPIPASPRSRSCRAPTTSWARSAWPWSCPATPARRRRSTTLRDHAAGSIAALQAPRGRARRRRPPAHRDGEGRPAGAAPRPRRRPANLTPPSWNSSSPPTRTSCATPSAPCSSASAR